MDWLDLLAVQGTLKKSSLALQFKSINSSVLSFHYGPPLTSIHDNWKNHSFDCMDFVGKAKQRDCFAFFMQRDSIKKYAIEVCHSFSSKEQASFNFMAAVNICSDFDQENKVCLFPLFPHLFAMKWWDRMP